MSKSPMPTIKYFDIIRTESLPPYYSNFSVKSDVLINIFNKLVLDSVTMTTFIPFVYINRLLDTLSLPRAPDTLGIPITLDNGTTAVAFDFDPYPLPDPVPVSLISLRQLLLMGLYYYCWMAKYVHEI